MCSKKCQHEYYKRYPGQWQRDTEIAMKNEKERKKERKKERGVIEYFGLYL